jgi:hypothetical protein
MTVLLHIPAFLSGIRSSSVGSSQPLRTGNHGCAGCGVCVILRREDTFACSSLFEVHISGKFWFHHYLFIRGTWLFYAFFEPLFLCQVCYNLLVVWR